jgi:hypothetical protein
MRPSHDEEHTSRMPQLRTLVSTLIQEPRALAAGARPQPEDVLVIGQRRPDHGAEGALAT